MRPAGRRFEVQLRMLSPSPNHGDGDREAVAPDPSSPPSSTPAPATRDTAGPPPRESGPLPAGGPEVPGVTPSPPVSAAPGPTSTSRSVLFVALGLVVVLAGGALFWSGYALGHREVTQPGTPVTEDEAFQPFWDAYHAVVDRYAGGPVDREALIEGAIKGMVGALGDPYSVYLPPKDYQQALEDVSGSFEGIGAEIGTGRPDGSAADCSTLGPDCLLTIVAPLDGSPAQAAGLKAGDQVVAVDGTSLDGLTVDEARDQIRGKKGTTVVLTVVRNGGQPFDLPIVRDVIVSKEVSTQTLAGGTVGYVKLNDFTDGGADQVVQALSDDVAAGRTKVVLDLRGNPGGFVTAARKVVSQFVSEGTIFWEEDAKGVQTATVALPDGVATDPKVAVVVLIDGGTASASEIVAGALQDLHRATIVGETSYGKGTVQQWTDLGTGGGGLKLTVAKWLTPDKRWINGVGIVPDVPVSVPSNLPVGSDPVLDKALEILGGSTAGWADPLRRAA